MKEYRLYDLLMLSPWMDKTKLQWDKCQNSKGCLWQGGNWLERVKKEVSWGNRNNFYIVLNNGYVCEYNWQDTSSWTLKTCTWCYIDYTSKVSKITKLRILEIQMMPPEKTDGENRKKRRWRGTDHDGEVDPITEENLCGKMKRYVASYLIFSWVFTMYQALSNHFYDALSHLIFLFSLTLLCTELE